MAKEIRIYKWYLILAIIYSILNLIGGILSFSPKLFMLSGLIMSPFIIAWFILNIVMLVLIFTKGIEKIAIILPGVYIFDTIFSIILGFIVGVVASVKGISVDSLVQDPVLLSLGLIFPVVGLIVAVWLISRR